MRISAWSSDVCSSDLRARRRSAGRRDAAPVRPKSNRTHAPDGGARDRNHSLRRRAASARALFCGRSEEHTSELQSLMRISYAVFCLKKKNKKNVEYTLWRGIVKQPDSLSSRSVTLHYSS